MRAVIQLDNVSKRYWLRRNRSGGLGSNEEHYRGGVRIGDGVDDDLVSLLFDPQTSGGLLIAVNPDFAAAAVAALDAAGVRAPRIGRAEALARGVSVRIMV